MTEKRPVPLQHLILYKDKLHLIKDEFNNIHRDIIQKVLKDESNDAFKKRNLRDDKKQAKDTVDEDGEKKKIDFKEKV